jgi:hypothetical protein
MPQRLITKSDRLDTTVARRSMEQINDLARVIERGGRRYQVSRTEVVELAIDWMFGKVRTGPVPQQPSRDERRDVRTGLKLPSTSMARLHQLATLLSRQPNYVQPPRTRPGEPSLGEAIDWCVSHFHAAMVKPKAKVPK